MTGENGACASKPSPEVSTILRTSENPLGWRPDAARRMTAPPGGISGPGNSAAAGGDIGSRQQRAAFRGTDSKAGKAVTAIPVEPGHFRRLPADQGAALL